MVRPARLERATCGFEVRRSIQLSYGRMILFYNLYFLSGVSEGARTLGIQDHNLALYQLSYTHHNQTRSLYQPITRIAILFFQHPSFFSIAKCQQKE